MSNPSHSGEGPYYWSAESYDALPEPIQRGREVLEKWFGRMQDGTAHLYEPDPARPIAEDKVNLCIERIEKSFAFESWLPIVGFDGGPGFDRLAPAQRLAMCQELQVILRGYRKDNVFTAWPHLGMSHYAPPPILPTTYDGMDMVG